MSFARYPEYKDSGLEWLGQVPEHWRKTALKFLGEYQNGYPFKPEDWGSEGLPIIRIAQLTGDREPNFYAGTLDSRVLVDCGDLLFSWSANIDSYIWSGDSAWLNQHIFKVTNTTEADKKFLFYVIKHVAPKLADFDAHGSTMRHIKKESLSERVFVPPIAEQFQIAAFLDREIAKTDGLVAEQRQLMALLKEKRQAVISHAVTRGLNPDAPMKPSGIEWLGDVPAHWEARTIAKASTKITNGFVGPTRDILVDAGTPYIQATHIKNGRVNFDSRYFVRPEWSVAHAKSILSTGDVLIVQTGAGTGDVGLVSVNEVGYNCHALIIVAPDKSLLHGTFLSAVLQSTYGQEKLTSIETGAMHPHLNCGEIKFVEIPLPPLDEQSDIVAYINRTAGQFDTLTAEAQRAIDLLQERRTALISAAVTGQIDVRAIAN